MMTPDEWQRAKEIIASALEIPEAKRNVFVEQACNGDDHMAAEINQMLGLAARVNPGDVINGQYRIERKLGEGGFGETYLASDLLLQDRGVLIKILKQKAGAPVLSDLGHEVRALAAIDHPGVVAPLATGALADGTPYLVMQFIPGANLGQLMREELMPVSRAAHILKQIGDALGAVHAYGILHRDLKPTNIMVQRLPNGSDHVRLIDFGIARILDNTEVTSVQTAAYGTLDYMAPEQMLGRSSKASDIYCMCVIAYELLTGVLPDSSSGHNEVAQFVKPPSKLRSSLPQIVDDLVLQGLELDFTARPQDAAVLGQQLNKALTPAQPRRWQFMAALACAATSLLAVTCTLLWQPRPVVSSPKSTIESPTSAPLRFALRIFTAGGAERRSSSLQPHLFQSESFQFELLAAETGYAYIFSEGAVQNPSMTVLFPTSTSNGYSSRISANQATVVPEHSMFGFKPGHGTDRVWIVWSRSRNETLESAARWATPTYAGVIGDRTEADTIRRRLTTWLTPFRALRDTIALNCDREIAAGIVTIQHD